jgi:hypothetical protein
MSLYELTRHLHHACEAHPFGQRMASGAISRGEWADWLGALSTIHTVLDPHLPPCLRRGPELLEDAVATLPDAPRPLSVAAAYARSLTGPVMLGGAAYIFSGAHFRGGAVMRKRLEPLGFSCAHLRFADAAGANAQIVSLRNIDHLAFGAQEAFAAILRIMGQINSAREAA